jgi:hypothetical protein
MEKILFSDLNLHTKNEERTININGQEIKYIPYLPMIDKLAFAEEVINRTAGDEETRFYNPGKLEVYQGLAIIKYYTNLELSEDDMLNATETYDKIVSNGIITALNQDEEYFEDMSMTAYLIRQTIDNIYKYTNSALGIITAASQDLIDTTADIEKLNEDISNPNTLTVLKDVMTKLG